MIEYREALETGHISVLIDGSMDRAEFNVIADQLEEAIERHGKVLVLEEVQDLMGVDPALFWGEFSLSLRHLNPPSRCAVVADPAWSCWIEKSVTPHVACELMHFAPAEAMHALGWLICSAYPTISSVRCISQRIADRRQPAWLSRRADWAARGRSLGTGSGE